MLLYFYLGSYMSVRLYLVTVTVRRCVSVEFIYAPWVESILCAMRSKEPSIRLGNVLRRETMT